MILCFGLVEIEPTTPQRLPTRPPSRRQKATKLKPPYINVLFSSTAYTSTATLPIEVGEEEKAIAQPEEANNNQNKWQKTACKPHTHTHSEWKEKPAENWR